MSANLYTIAELFIVPEPARKAVIFEAPEHDDAVCKCCSSQAANHISGMCDGCEEIKACEGCPYGGSPNEGCPMYCSVWAKSEFAK